MDPNTLLQWLGQYGEFSKEFQHIIAPRKAQIKALELAIEDETAHLVFEMATLETLIKPAVLALKQTQKAPYVTAVYISQDKWDRDMLFHIAVEVPTVMLAHTDASYVRMTKTAR
jgi:hypothetical protein